MTTIANYWGLPQGFLRNPLSLKHVVYVKSRAKAPFQTWDQIERRIARQRLSAAEARRLWESVFLNAEETRRLLEHVGVRGDPLATVMFQFAAYTGASFTAFLQSLKGRAPRKPQLLDEPYFHGAGPTTMHIDEVERVWAAIAERDDWTLLDKKVAEVRALGSLF